jgi:mRNA interferase RelE/StbE
LNTEFKESFLRDLRTIKDRALLERVKEVIERVEQAPKVQDLANLKKLKGERNYYRFRVGDYRIGLKIEGSLVTFVRILNRKDIYKYFPR